MTQAKLGDRALFSTLEAAAYLNHAAIAALSDPAVAAIGAAAGILAQRGSLGFAQLLAVRERARANLATLLGATPREVALVPNTMHGLANVALGLPWRRGDRILLWTGEYPTNVTVFLRAAELFSLSVTLLPTSDLLAPGGADLGRLDRELRRGGVRLCAISAVQFQTGVRAPLAEIARLCHAYDAQLVVDAVQALGAVPLDARALGIDYLAAGAHKWLMGCDGAGVLYVAAERLPELSPPSAGAFAFVGAMDLLAAGPGHLRYDRPLRDDAQRFEGGMLSSTSCAALEASLSLLLTLGVPEIHAHVGAYLDALEPRFVARGFESLRAPEAERRSCILSLRPPAGHAATQLAAALAASGIVCASPDGLLRIAPHWPNSLAEIPRIVDALDRVLRATTA
jgi:cysteine desulfurase / selenocysteine lyase